MQQIGMPVNEAKLALEGEPSAVREILGVMVYLQSRELYIRPRRLTKFKRELVPFSEVRHPAGYMAFVGETYPMARPSPRRGTW